jgi:hypothetical protein
MELVPKADGTMAETRFVVDVDKAIADAAELLAQGGEQAGRGDSAGRVQGYWQGGRAGAGAHCRRCLA